MTLQQLADATAAAVGDLGDLNQDESVFEEKLLTRLTALGLTAERQASLAGGRPDIIVTAPAPRWVIELKCWVLDRYASGLRDSWEHDIDKLRAWRCQFDAAAWIVLAATEGATETNETLASLGRVRGLGEPQETRVGRATVDDEPYGWTLWVWQIAP